MFAWLSGDRVHGVTPPPCTGRLGERRSSVAYCTVLLSFVAGCGPEPSSPTPALLTPNVRIDCPRGTRLEVGRGCVAAVVSSPNPSLGPSTANAASPRPSTAPDAAPEGLGSAMVRIPAGSFNMGSNDGDDDEKPVHHVSLASFEMDVTEVSTAQYEACVQAGSCPAAATAKYCNADAHGGAHVPHGARTTPSTATATPAGATARTTPSTVSRGPMRRRSAGG